MAIISNKDLEQFGNIINTLINQTKTAQHTLQDNNNKTGVMIKEYAEMTVKNQQQFIQVFKRLELIIEKSLSRELPPNFANELKKDFDGKVDNALSEIRSKFLNQNKISQSRNYIIIIVILISLAAVFLLAFNLIKNTDAIKNDAIKYKLFLKYSKGLNRKNYLRWDSIANTFTLTELEQSLKKTEGK